jgi:hypothetical protein
VSVNNSIYASLETWYPLSPLVGALQSSNKMVYFTDVEKAKYVLQFKQNHSATQVQRWFRKNYGKEAPTSKSIYKWHKSFDKTGCICAKKKNSGRRPSDETAERVLAPSVRSPQKSTRRASRELGDVCHTTVDSVMSALVSPTVQIATAAGAKAQRSSTSEIRLTA